MSDTLISRTMRAAIRIGEDFYTLEETITLPADANEAAITQAVDLGWQIYRAQRAAAETQIEEMRGSIVAVLSLASEKQRNFISALQNDLGWDGEFLGQQARLWGWELATLTRDQASSLIDRMRELLPKQAERPAQRPPPKTAAEAQQRFFVRYQDKIGGATWASVQKYLGTNAPMPRTIDGWIDAATAVNEKGAQPAPSRRSSG
jgi:hypothetical protein